MKTLLNIVIAALMLLSVNAVSAQNSKADKKAAKELAVMNKIDSVNYTFKATYMIPLQGPGRPIVTNDYDLRVKKDSVIAYLPFFGRVYMKAPINSNDGGLKFTSTKFDYKTTTKKKGGWRVTIIIKDTDKANRITLDISPNGSATLVTVGNFRDAITFYGNIVTDNK
ncbi:DUF4251 domain-containing protein [Mucilaginibacter limnophilus]|uniref:DUF4251 domain-containing protein n=1 Tax=Mucilaginibacter limnophilus TaxID=1932778 RepID=A0A3S2Y3E1_9SPHI|nr:DUF4251 domain-containing protein [Mucilaginibacter limnophilus]RVU01025.1 DUF4251 domain-containing protein [Mucilaginibacter limnophilus]